MALSHSERDIVKQAASLIRREAEAGERVTLQGFGTFKRTTKAARTARNPQTNESVQVPEKTVITFKASAPL